MFICTQNSPTRQHFVRQLKMSGDPQPVDAVASEGIHCNNRRDSEHPSGFHLSLLLYSLYAELSRTSNYLTLRAGSPTKMMAPVLPWPTGRFTGAPPTTPSTSTRCLSITTCSGPGSGCAFSTLLSWAASQSTKPGARLWCWCPPWAVSIAYPSPTQAGWKVLMTEVWFQCLLRQVLPVPGSTSTHFPGHRPPSFPPLPARISLMKRRPFLSLATQPVS